jgi:hypothetical protein
MDTDDELLMEERSASSPPSYPPAPAVRHGSRKRSSSTVELDAEWWKHRSRAVAWLSQSCGVCRESFTLDEGHERVPVVLPCDCAMMLCCSCFASMVHYAIRPTADVQATFNEATRNLQGSVVLPSYEHFYIFNDIRCPSCRTILCQGGDLGDADFSFSGAADHPQLHLKCHVVPFPSPVIGRDLYRKCKALLTDLSAYHGTCPVCRATFQGHYKQHLLTSCARVQCPYDHCDHRGDLEAHMKRHEALEATIRQMVQTSQNVDETYSILTSFFRRQDGASSMMDELD